MAKVPSRSPSLVMELGSGAWLGAADASQLVQQLLIDSLSENSSTVLQLLVELRMLHLQNILGASAIPSTTLKESYFALAIYR
ncbi:hypothetical protein BKA70DRAFT_1574243 [Coprinopsis sp. MPI-PUGE-AT-0042]|nr:hypothetical protein BKA70DRAFT_1574243 [Coprinopsis sp. MPI-PUGE-AT-0042]